MDIYDDFLFSVNKALLIKGLGELIRFQEKLNMIIQQLETDAKNVKNRCLNNWI